MNAVSTQGILGLDDLVIGFGNENSPSSSMVQIPNAQENLDAASNSGKFGALYYDQASEPTG